MEGGLSEGVAEELRAANAAGQQGDALECTCTLSMYLVAPIQPPPPHCKETAVATKLAWFLSDSPLLSPMKTAGIVTLDPMWPAGSAIDSS